MCIRDRPEIFDSCFEFEKIDVYFTTFHENHPEHHQPYFVINPVNEVEKINDDMSLVWKYNFEEMKERVSKGLLVEGYVWENLKGMENYL